MSEINVLVDLRDSFGPIRNQGPRPTCLAFAASDTHAALRQGWTPLSCEYAFYQAQRRANRPPHTGAVLSFMLKALREDGQPEEAGWPYLTVNPSDADSWTPPLELGKRFGRNGMISSPAFEDVIQHLDHGHPMITLLMLSRSFYRPNLQGIVDPANDEQPEIDRRHAVIAAGHGTIDGQRAVLVRNSWGPNWGEAGYGWLTVRFLIPRIFAAAKLMEDVDVSAHSAAA
jgi:Papain family cysteine protease